MANALNGKRQVQYGAVLSYVLIILNAMYGVFLTPYIIGQIGEAAYGVYKTVSAFTASLMVLDLGLGGTMMRYITRYRVDGEDHKIPNFIFMGFMQAGIICVLVGIVTAVLYFFLDVIYQNGLTIAELEDAKRLYVFLAIGIIVHILENLLNGIISGYNQFVFANGVKVVRLLIRILATVVFLGIFKNALVLVLVDLFCTIAFVFAELGFILGKLKLRVKFSHWDASEFLDSFRYTILMFLTSLVVQANSNIPNVAIGALINSTAVTVYSMAVLIFGMFEQMSTAISGVMLPTITETLKYDDEKCTKTMAVVAKAGRIQFLLLGAIFCGFLVLGPCFVQLWLGEGFEDVYSLTIILLGPALLELCINVCLSILRAKNILGFRTIVISLSSVLNLAITITFMRYLGYYAAAIGTASSFLFGTVITMGIYYYKKLNINILRLYQKIFAGIWLCLLLSTLGAYGITLVVDSAWLTFAIGFIVFVVIYAITLLLFGLKNEERKIIINRFRRKKT